VDFKKGRIENHSPGWQWLVVWKDLVHPFSLRFTMWRFMFCKCMGDININGSLILMYIIYTSVKYQYNENCTTFDIVAFFPYVDGKANSCPCMYKYVYEPILRMVHKITDIFKHIPFLEVLFSFVYTILNKYLSNSKSM